MQTPNGGAMAIGAFALHRHLAKPTRENNRKTSNGEKNVDAEKHFESFQRMHGRCVEGDSRGEVR